MIINLDKLINLHIEMITIIINCWNNNKINQIKIFFQNNLQFNFFILTF